MNTKTINGYTVKTSAYFNHRVPSHARRLCAALDRDDDAVERVAYSTQMVTVWLDTENKRASFETPDGWEVVRSGVYGGGFAVDLEPEDRQ